MEEGILSPCDPISGLPESVLHEILSHLPIKDAARTSVLSRSWNSAWSSLPYLNFISKDFSYKFNSVSTLEGLRLEKKKRKRNKHLVKAAIKIISSRCQQNKTLQKLCIIIPYHEISPRLRRPSLADTLVRRLLYCLAMSSIVKELDLQIVMWGGIYYDLPPTMHSAKSINALSLCGFNLMSLASLHGQFADLRKLRLGDNYLNDYIMEKIIIGCHLLEDLQLVGCKGLKNIHVVGLLKLKMLKVYMVGLEVLRVDAPHLQVLSVVREQCKLYVTSSFGLRELRLSWTATLNIDIASCASLRNLRLSKVHMSTDWLHDFVSQCPILENLRIGDYQNWKSISISSHTLRTLRIGVMEDPVEVNINAPNLEKFHFEAIKANLANFLLNASDMLEIELGFYRPVSDDAWYDELTKFLGYFSRFNTVKLHGSSKKVVVPKERRESFLSPLCGTRNLVLHATWEKVAAVELVEYMLWLAPQAESLSITNKDDADQETETSLKFLYEKNVQSDSSPCCELLPINCWRHCLSEVILEIFEGDEDERISMKNFFLEAVKNLKIVEMPSSLNGLYASYDQRFT